MWKKLFMHELEVLDLAVIVRIADGELELRLRSGARNARSEFQIHRELFGLGYARPQFHPATGTEAFLVRPDVGIHRALVDHVLRTQDWGQAGDG
jgi:hypothetical protein